MPSPIRRRDDSPLTRDVKPGRGGIAGGRFTHGNTDTFTEQSGYVRLGYLDGQDTYVMEQS